MSDKTMPDQTISNQATPNDAVIRDNLCVTKTVSIGICNTDVPLYVYSAANPTIERIQSAVPYNPALPQNFGASRIAFRSGPFGDANEWRPGFIQSTDNGNFTGGLAFYVNGTGPDNKFGSLEVMRLVNGNVAIGTTNPSRKLHVEGSEIHSGGAGAGISFGNRETPGFVNIPTAGERWVLYSSGGTARLWSGGDIVFFEPRGVVRATQFMSASSRQLKDNIAELSSSEAIETLENLNPVKFNYKADDEKNLHVGFIAEDVPELVATSDRKGLSAMDIVAVLTQVVKEQQKTMAALAEKVKFLEGRPAEV